MTWKIQAITGELTGQEISIDRDMLVGRHQSADIVLQAAEISRKHAAFLLKDQALWLEDLNSSNGTFVNDLRIEQETLLKQGDIVQFASFKFSLLAPAKELVPPETEFDTPIIQAEVISSVEQPSEAIAVSETAAAQVEESIVEQEAVVKTDAAKTVAQQMNEQGMPSLTERERDIQVSREGMPQQVAIPKPAPIPEGTDLTAQADAKAVGIEESVSRVQLEKTEQKNASLGLMSIIALIIFAFIAWLLFK